MQRRETSERIQRLGVGDVQRRGGLVVTHAPGQRQLALFTAATPVVVDQLVPGDAHQPRHRGRVRLPVTHGANAGDEGFLRQVLRELPIAGGCPVEVAVYVAKGTAVERRKSGLEFASVPLRRTAR